MAGLVACFRALREKMVKDPLPPEAVAGGWALGVFVGFAIPFGLQLVVSVPLALMMRVSKVGATLGTFVTNPMTILFIYPVQMWAVDALLFGGSLSLANLFSMDWTWIAVRKLGVDAVLSLFIGGIALALIASPLTYFLVRRVVVEHRRRIGLRAKQKQQTE